MCKVVCGNSVRLEKHHVLVVFGDLKIAADKVGYLDSLFGISVRNCEQGKFVTCRKLCLHLLDSELTAGEHSLTARLGGSLPVCVLDFCFFIGSRHFGKLLIGREHGISASFFN